MGNRGKLDSNTLIQVVMLLEYIPKHTCQPVWYVAAEFMVEFLDGGLDFVLGS